MCLGTSLRVHPACDLPGFSQGPLFIVNLQATPKDADALRSGGLLLHGRIDLVMKHVMSGLGLTDQIREVSQEMEFQRDRDCFSFKRDDKEMCSL